MGVSYRQKNRGPEGPLYFLVVMGTSELDLYPIDC